MINLHEIQSIFQSCTSTDEMVAIFNAIGECTVSNSDYKVAKKNLIELLEREESHNATALVLSLVKSKGDSSLNDLRKIGAFRLSRYRYGRSAVIAISTLANVADKAGLSAESIRYLASLKALHSLRADLLRMENLLISAVAGAECNTVIELKPEHHAALPWHFA